MFANPIYGNFCPLPPVKKGYQPNFPTADVSAKNNLIYLQKVTNISDETITKEMDTFVEMVKKNYMADQEKISNQHVLIHIDVSELRNIYLRLQNGEVPIISAGRMEVNEKIKKTLMFFFTFVQYVFTELNYKVRVDVTMIPNGSGYNICQFRPLRVLCDANGIDAVDVQLEW